MRIQKVNCYMPYTASKVNENKYNRVNLNKVSFGDNTIHRTPAKDRSDSLIFNLPVEYVHELSKSRFYRPNVFIGDSFYDDIFNTYDTQECIEIAKASGIKTIIDLDKNSETYRKLVESAGLKYYSFPVRSCVNFDRSSKKEAKDKLVDFIKEMQKDDIYVGGGWMSRDMAAEINFWFNPKYDCVYLSSFETADMMKSFASEMYSCLTEKDKKSIGWTPEYEKKFKEKLNL